MGVGGGGRRKGGGGRREGEGEGRGSKEGGGRQDCRFNRTAICKVILKRVTAVPVFYHQLYHV